MHSAITNLTHTRDANASHASDLRRKLASTKSSIADKRRQLKDRDSYLQYQAGFNGPECRFWEEGLGLKIQGTGREDRVRFSFVFGRGSGNRSSSETESWFELDMTGSGAAGGKGYEVVRARPNLDDAGMTDRVDACVREMCDSQDLGSFLKGMRQIFLDAIH